MATAAQVQANRANAQKSTGPRTAEGKATVAQNAVKHGLLARAAVLQGEDPEEFTEFREQLLEELAPEGIQETILAAATGGPESECGVRGAVRLPGRLCLEAAGGVGPG